jgi:hypothetical protein
MIDLTFGELFVVGFIFVAIVSAPYWPKAGERLILLFARKQPPARDKAE